MSSRAARPASAGTRASVSNTSPGHLSGNKIYPWSVVSGGLDSPVVMKAAMTDDPVVREHYAGLDPSQFRAERLAAPRRGYVSYRIRDKVYWTRKPATLAAGELVLTDGQSMLRGRCGNQVSSIPREPVAPPSLEPPETALDTPVDIAQLAFAPSFPGISKAAPPTASAAAAPVEPKAAIPVGGPAKPEAVAQATGVIAPPAPPLDQVLYSGSRNPSSPPVVPPPSVTEPGGTNLVVPMPFLPPPGGPSGPIVIAGLQPPTAFVLAPPAIISPDYPALPPSSPFPPAGPSNPPVVTPPGNTTEPPPGPTDPPPGPTDPPPGPNPPGPNPPGPNPPGPNPPGPNPPGTSVPEPSTWFLAAVGLVGLVWRGRRAR